jgi:hypothetical protein
MSPRRNWDSPNPSLASEFAPPPRTGVGHTRLRVRGWGSPNSDDLRKSLALCLLCGILLSLYVENIVNSTTTFVVVVSFASNCWDRKDTNVNIVQAFTF